MLKCRPAFRRLVFVFILYGLFLVETAVENSAFRNVFLILAIVLYIYRNDIHVCVIGTGKPAGNGDIVVVVFLLEFVGHVVDAGDVVSSVDFHIDIIA